VGILLEPNLYANDPTSTDLRRPYYAVLIVLLVLTYATIQIAFI
jgi:hypothetical protein